MAEHRETNSSASAAESARATPALVIVHSKTIAAKGLNIRELYVDSALHKVGAFAAITQRFS
jgi:hypothetical protein